VVSTYLAITHETFVWKLQLGDLIAHQSELTQCVDVDFALTQANTDVSFGTWM
jgi:hypothetical protein